MQTPSIRIQDTITPENNCMLQALYSRSASSVTEHLGKVAQLGSGEFMKKFYVGYGHKSIADCGSTTIFIENVSMLAAKAIQDNPLYSGQESSTRYLDMANRMICDPIDSKESRRIMNRWMDFYRKLMVELPPHLASLYPRYTEEQNGVASQVSEAVYNKAIQARAFDIARAFLPAGITTQLSWHTNLRQAHDNLFRLVFHPLDEVRMIGHKILFDLQREYPNTFHTDYYKRENDNDDNLIIGLNGSTKEDEAYFKDLAMETAYRYQAEDFHCWDSNTLDINWDRLYTDFDQFESIFRRRPRGAPLPQFLNAAGLIHFKFRLDFASYRDLQRHRSGILPMPLLQTREGFNEWYLKQLPGSAAAGSVYFTGLRLEAEQLITAQKHWIKDLRTTPEIAQYYTAMGFNVVCEPSYTIPALVYVMELRSGKMVHPTLRAVAQWMSNRTRDKLGKLFTLHTDHSSPETFDPRRGNQDITAK